MLGGGPTDAAQTAGPALDGEDLWIHARASFMELVEGLGYIEAEDQSTYVLPLGEYIASICKHYELAISLPGMPMSTLKKEYNKANNPLRNRSQLRRNTMAVKL